LLLDYWPLKKFVRGQILWTVLEKLPLFILAAGSMYMSSMSFKNPPYLPSVPMGLRIANALVSYIKYILKLAWPADLAVLYPYPSSVPAWQSVGSLLLLICVSALVILLMRKRPYLVTGWLWYIGTLVPVLGLVQIGLWPAMADRWMYVPSVGIFIIITWAATDLFAEWRYGKFVLRIAAVLILAALLICTKMQVNLWKNNFTLFEHTLKVTRNNYLILNNYGITLCKNGRLDEGIAQFIESLRINPRHANTHYNLGLAYAKKIDLEKAAAHLRKSLELKPDDPYTLINLAAVLIMNKESPIYDGNEALRLAELACNFTDYKNPEMLRVLTKAQNAAIRKTE